MALLTPYSLASAVGLLPAAFFFTISAFCWVVSMAQRPRCSIGTLALAIEYQIFLVELHSDAFLCETGNDLLQVKEVPGQPVNAVNVQGVTFAQVLQTLLQGRTLYMLCRYLVGEYFLQLHTCKLLCAQLSVGVLVNTAYPDISEMWCHGSPL